MSTGTVKLTRPITGFHLPGELGEIDPASLEDQLARDKEREMNSLMARIEQLEIELQAAREDSFNAGFQDGLQAEREKHKTKIEAYAQQFGDLAIRLNEEFGQALSDMEEPLLRMSFEISEKVLRLAIPDKLKTKGLLATLQEFLKEVLHAESVVIRLSPQNFEWVQSPKVTESLEQSFPGSMKFVADPQLGVGECILETAEHVIDGTFKHQLENLERNLQ
ncbi:MAG: hypothetical protein IID15_06055 [Candidatus Marinimicrobia bacterium]|nr:hypothetical protein [Candidatus Neomarinimicrobiota bacterium]